MTRLPARLLSCLVGSLALLPMALPAAEGAEPPPPARTETGADAPDAAEPAAAAAAAPDDTADAECGPDRRCRIERLKRLNRDRRLLDGLKRDDRIARLQELLAERVLPTRQRSPWLVAVRLARLGATGGLTVLPRLQVELGISSLDDHRYRSSGPGTSGGTNFQLTALEATVVGLLSTGAVSPYASLGGSYLWGSADTWMNRWETGESSSSQARVVVHALRFGVGLDALFLDRAHLRLGVVYQPTLYHQARVAPGVYDAALRDTLGGWLKDDLRIHPEIRIGYAFDL